MKKIELEIVALSHSITQTHSYAVVLGEVNGLSRLPIVIGGFEAQAIAVALERMQPSRPLTHDLMKNFMYAFNVELMEIIINDLQEGIFYSKLVCVNEHDTVEIDSRTSDALALAVRFGCPIYTYENILENAGILMEDENKRKAEIPVQDPGSSSAYRDLTKMSLEELQKLLTEVLEHEDYIRAIEIRDEINKRQIAFKHFILIGFPNCKINIGLNVLGKREDGYHNIETIFYPLPFYDVLEVIQSENASQQCQLFLSGIKVDGNAEDNLCIKAYHLLKKDFPQLPAVKIYLHKAISVGAGLGGGSADGAFMLMLMNEKFKLNLSVQQLMQHALNLGSDCPFFIINKPCFAQQRGENLQPVSINLSGYKIVIINPGIHINTAWAFTQVKFSNNKLIKNINTTPVEEWKNISFERF